MIRRYFQFAGYLLPALAVCTSFALLGAQAKPSGADPYVPTKQQWLCVSFNALYRERLDRDGAEMTIKACLSDEPNHIHLVGVIRKKTDRAFFNQLFQQSKKILEEDARSLGFDNWLVIKEEVHVLK